MTYAKKLKGMVAEVRHCGTNHFLYRLNSIRRSLIGELFKCACVANFAPTGINKWLSKAEGGPQSEMSIFLRCASDTNHSFWAPEVGVV